MAHLIRAVVAHRREVHEPVFQRAAEHLHRAVFERERQVVAVERKLESQRRAVGIRVSTRAVGAERQLADRAGLLDVRGLLGAGVRAGQDLAGAALIRLLVGVRALKSPRAGQDLVDGAVASLDAGHNICSGRRRRLRGGGRLRLDAAAGAAGDQKRAEQKNCGRKKLKTFHQNNLLSGALAMPALTGAAAVSGCRSTTTNMATMSSAFGIGQNMPGFVMEMAVRRSRGWRGARNGSCGKSAAAGAAFSRCPASAARSVPCNCTALRPRPRGPLRRGR